jgi:hypothetical protein
VLDFRKISYWRFTLFELTLPLGSGTTSVAPCGALIAIKIFSEKSGIKLTSFSAINKLL